MQDLIDQVTDFFDSYPLVEALVIIVLFAVLARIVDWLLSGTIRRLTSKTETDFDDEIIELLHRPIFRTVVLIGIIIATISLELPDTAETITVTIVQTILVVVWIMFFMRFFRLLLGYMKRRKDRFGIVQETTEPLLSNAVAVVFFLIAVYSILVIWDINITGLVASAGIVGLALSFAAQDTLANLFAGVAILSDKPYKIGDYIILDTGERGEVTRIGLRSTRLLTRDDVEISIPNGVMGAAKIVNEAGGPPRQFRIRTMVGVAYGSDLDQVVDVLNQVALDHPEVLKRPESRVRFRTFGASSLDFELLCWISQPANRGRTLHELNMEIYRRLDEAGIIIPFAQQDIYIKEMPGTQAHSEATSGPDIADYPPPMD